MNGNAEFREKSAEARDLLGAMGKVTQAFSDVADHLGLSERSSRLRGAFERLRSDTFDLLLVGPKSGKSLLVNALLGKLTHAVPELANMRGPMPVDDLPCTATLTRIKYAEEPAVTAWRSNGKGEPWSVTQYLREARIRGSEEETATAFKDIREFEVAFPAELCKTGVTLIDAPGTDDAPARTDVTRQAVKRCDAAVVVYRHDVFVGESDRKFVSTELLGKKTRVFTVVNVFGERAVDERLKSFVWNRLVQEMQGGPRYEGQDLASRGIFFVNAAKALEGKLRDDADLVERSGLAQVERTLRDFRANELHRVRLERVEHAAHDLAAEMRQTDPSHRGRRNAARTDGGENKRELHKRLREVLAKLIPGNTERHMALYDANVDHLLGTIDYRGAAETGWFYVILELEKHEGSLQKLLDTLREQHPDHEPLGEFMTHWNRTARGSKDSHG